MKKLLKSLLNKVLPKPINETPKARSAVVEGELLYSIALNAILSTRKKTNSKLNIAVVGANDGKINDSIYNFAMHNSSYTRVMLVEPQPELQEILKYNYHDHPAAFFVQAAISQENNLSIYRINKDKWDSFQPDYSKDWPSYRAASGIASANIDLLIKQISDFGYPDLVGSIERLDVTCMSLESAINKVNAFDMLNLDVLQIDVEGLDDKVIYASNIHVLKPSIIRYESAHISPERRRLLQNYLTDQGYYLAASGRDEIALFQG